MPENIEGGGADAGGQSLRLFGWNLCLMLFLCISFLSAAAFVYKYWGGRGGSCSKMWVYVGICLAFSIDDQ